MALLFYHIVGTSFSHLSTMSTCLARMITTKKTEDGFCLLCSVLRLAQHDPNKPKPGLAQEWPRLGSSLEWQSSKPKKNI